MASPTDLQSWRDSLFQARLSGVRSLRDQNGETVTYATDQEMAAAITAADREIIAATAGAAPKTIIFRTSKGL